MVVHHIENLANWQKSKIFVYGGREDSAMTLFTSGQCPILMESSGSRSMLKANVDFPVGVADIPYYASQVKGVPQNMLTGGAALWALSGHSKKIEEGTARFFIFLTKPNIQAFWQQQTGYLPVTKSAFELSKKQGFYKKNPGAEVAIQQLTRKPPTVNSRGIRLGAYPQIRMINAQELEAVFSGQLTAKQALDKAVQRGNAVLHDFALNVGQQ
jgi:sn-glycerol 3-phosphate transport system substrate-binding protein